MPNWTHNVINANPEVIKHYLNDEGKFDFNKAIPMPESLNIEAGSTTDDAIAVFVTEKLTIPVKETNLDLLVSNSFHIGSWGEEVVRRLKEDKDADLDKLYELGKQAVSNYENYGCFTWYEWCNKNWNSKWNACDTYVNPDYTSVEFDTAWDMPTPIFEDMCWKFPKETITFYSSYEEGLVVEAENQNGVFTITDEYNDWDEEEYCDEEEEK